MGRVMTVLSAAAVLVGSAAAQQTGTFTDGRDGQTYKTVKIGEQTWMAQNLNYNTPNGSWSCGSRCNDNSLSYCEKYGRLYNWEIAKTVCPAGWKLPDTADWNRLVATAGGWKTAAKTLKSKSGWIENGNGTDDYGFSALPGGYRSGDGCGSAGIYGSWWTATEFESNYAYYRDMHCDRDYVNELNTFKGFGHSVRCVADPP